METIQLRGVTLGRGRPKICAPLTSATIGDLLEEVRKVKASEADLVEWRADHFTGVSDPFAVLKALEPLRRALGELPLIFTFRTKAEGGRLALEPDVYAELVTTAAASGNADAVDIELSQGDGAVTRLVETAHRYGVAAVVSSHDFSATPPEDDLLETLHQMADLGADLPKLAVMPARFADVLALLAATEEFTRATGRPAITMSMGKLGCVSRVVGQFTGSVITFGSVHQASAPGQMEAGELQMVLTALGRE